MGAITRIRQISPYFLGFVAVLFVAFMVIQDSSCDTIQRSRQSPENVVVAEVNGDRITLAEYERRVRDVVDRQRQQNPNQEIDDDGVRQQVFDEMVNELLRRQEASKMGISVTTQQLIDVMVINPPEQLQFFKDSTGQFQKQLYQDLVTNPNKLGELLTQQKAPQEEIDRQVAEWKKTLLDIEDGLRTQLLQQNLTSAMGAVSSIPSPTNVEQMYISDSSTADVSFVALGVNAIADKDAAVSDAELKAYYEANKEYYLQKRSRKVKYLIFPQLPSLKDSATAQKRSQKLAEMFASLATKESRDSAFSVEMAALSGTSVDYAPMNEVDPMTATVLSSLQQGETFGPLTTPSGIVYLRLDGRRDGENPVVRASHILIPFASDGSKDLARTEAMKIYNQAKKGGDFSELARLNSKDPGSAQQGGDLNYFGKGRMVKPFEDAAFSASIGDVVGPVETQFGFHIIKVTDRQSSELKFSKITIKPVISAATKQQIMAKAQQSADQITSGTPMDTVAAKMQMGTQESGLFTSDSPILSSREITSWAFDSKKGDVTRKDVKYYGTVVAQVSDAREPGVKEFDDVVDRIRYTLTARKKMDMLKDKAMKVSEAIKSAGSLDAALTIDPSLSVVSQTGVKHNGSLTGFGGEYLATAKALSTEPGAITDAIRGDKAWFILRVNANKKADLNLFAAMKTMLMNSMSARNRGSAYYSWFQKIRENADIKDLRNNRSN